MKGDKIPDDNHIARCCMPKHVSVADGQIQATAFLVRSNEDSLSVNWLELLKCANRTSEIAELRKIYSTKVTIGARAKIAVLNVGEVCEKVLMESADRRKLEILHEPEFTEKYNDPSHCGIYNLRNDDMLIAELILEAVRDTYPARNP